MASYDGTVSMSRKLTGDETQELRMTLIPYFTTEGGMGVDDIADFLDYTFTMVSNSKAVDYIVKELDGFCSEEVSKQVGKELADYIIKLNKEDDSDSKQVSTADDDGRRVVSLKSEKGNALTMSGALGSSREGGRNKKENPTKARPEKKDDKYNGDHQEKRRGINEERGRNDRKDSDRKGGRGSHSVQGVAFDRLARGSDRKDDRGRDERRRDDRGDPGRGRSDRDDGFDRRRDDRGGRGPGGHGPRDMGGRGGRDGGRGDRLGARGGRDGGRGGRDGGRGGRDGGRGGRDGARGGRDGGREGRDGGGASMAGQRRSRDELEETDFIPADNRGGNSPSQGRGRGGRDGPKRPRYDEGSGDGYGHHDGYGYGSFYAPTPPSFYSDYHPSPFSGGRGGRGRGRGRGLGRASDVGGEAPAEGGEGEGAAGQSTEGGVDGGEGDWDHPSPMVQAAFGGRGGYGYGGRGFVHGGRGRGRGRGGGRAQIVSMIQSKTWVRKKDDGNEGNGASNAGDFGDTEV